MNRPIHYAQCDRPNESHNFENWTDAICGHGSENLTDEIQAVTCRRCLSIVNKKTAKEKIIEYSTPEPNTGCWLWTAGLTAGGYAKIKIDYSTKVAHRVSYESFKGPIPEDKMILHSCDVRCCVNPDHLSLGTHLENMRDMVNRKRVASGENHPYASISDSDVVKIRQMITEGHTHLKIAQTVGCSKGYISKIRHNLYRKTAK